MSTELAEKILQYAAGRKRYFVALAGPPASGKTTLSGFLENHLKRETTVSVVAMDGFHFDNEILRKKDLLDRKGSPETFDVTSLYQLLTGLKTQTDTLAVPVFDREKDLARSSAKLVHPQDHIILVEGNYLLCNIEPWNKLHSLFDHTISISTSMNTLENRLIQRWLDHNHTQEQAVKRAKHNDLPNAEYVIKNSISADTTINSQ